MNFKKLFETLTGENPETEKVPVHQHNYFNDLPRPLTDTEKENYYRMSVQRTDADLVVRSEKGVAMDSAEDNNSASQAVYNNMVGAIPDIIYSHFAAQGFIGYNACAILKQNWMISNACTVPAEDAIQPGYTLCNKDDTEVISEDELENFKAISYSKFHIDEICKQLEINKKVFGVGLAVPCMDDDYDYENPFNIDGVKPNSYKGWSIVDPYWFAPELDEDAATNPASKYFYQPTWYRMPNGKRVHRSHCIVLTNSVIPDILKPTYFYGGIPLTQMIFQRVYAAEKVANEAPLLALTKRLLVVDANLENFVANQRDAEETLKTISWLRDNFGVAIKRPGDQIQQIDTGLTDFDSLIMTQYQLVASIAQMPATKLLKTTPKGFNATGEFELKDYIQLLQSIQENDMKPLIERHNLLLAKSKFNKDMQIVVKFNPIDMPTEADKASINQATASTLSTLTQSGIISPEEARARLKQDELAGFPTIDTDAVPEDGAEDIQAMLQNAMANQKKNDVATDSADWKESEHPRDKDGKFTSKGGMKNFTSVRTNVNPIRTEHISDNEKEAIRNYTNEWNSTSYKDINSYLRTGRINSSFLGPQDIEKKLAKIKDTIKHLDSAMSQSVFQYDTELSRGTDLQEFSSLLTKEDIEKADLEVIRHKLVGNQYRAPGFISTSLDTEDNKFSKNQQVDMKITAPAGTQGINIDNFSTYGGEAEVLLKRDTKFKVISVDEGKNKGTFTVNVEAIPEKKVSPEPLNNNLFEKFKNNQKKTDFSENFAPIEKVLQEYPNGAKEIANMVAFELMEGEKNDSMYTYLFEDSYDLRNLVSNEKFGEIHSSLNKTIDKIIDNIKLDDLKVNEIKRIESNVKKNPTSLEARNEYEYISNNLDKHVPKNEIVPTISSIFKRYNIDFPRILDKYKTFQARNSEEPTEEEELQNKNDIASDSADWKESDHPRDEDGKFTDKGGTSSSATSTNTRLPKKLLKVFTLNPKGADLTQKMTHEDANELGRALFTINKNAKALRDILNSSNRIPFSMTAAKEYADTYNEWIEIDEYSDDEEERADELFRELEHIEEKYPAIKDYLGDGDFHISENKINTAWEQAMKDAFPILKEPNHEDVLEILKENFEPIENYRYDNSQKDMEKEVRDFRNDLYDLKDKILDKFNPAPVDLITIATIEARSAAWNKATEASD